MNHDEIVQWLESHREQVDGVPADLVARCEHEVRRHAAENAWKAAEAYVEGRMHQWEQQWGQHATESGVAREVCSLLAGELRRHEPSVIAGDEAGLAGEELMARLEPAARERVGGWVLELAQQVEHSIWKQIVRFTRKDGRSMVKEGRVSSDETWEGTENYAHKAAHVAQLLLEDYERELATRQG
jgi:hypothetical protein